MKQFFALAALCCVFLACASNDVKIIPPELTFVQITGASEQNYPQGDFEVQYGLRIANRSSEPITLRHIQLRSTGLGGPYQLVPRTYYFEKEVKPEQFEDVTFWARAQSLGDAGSPDATAPVTYRATAFFEAPSGNFRRVFTGSLHQTGETSRPR